MAFPDSTWPRGGDEWHEWSTPSSEVNVIWDIHSFLRGCQNSKKEMRSPTSHFADKNGTWNFFTSFELEKGHSQFGVNFRAVRVSYASFDWYFDIKFLDYNDMEMKKIEFELRVEKSSRADSHREVKDFLSSHELERFLRRGCTCYITVRKSRIEETSPQAEIRSLIPEVADSSSMESHTIMRVMESHTETQLPGSYPMAFPDSAWTVAGKLSDQYYELVDLRAPVTVPWIFGCSLRQYRKGTNELRSPSFTFMGAIWYFFISFDLKQGHSQFGINIQPHRLSHVVFGCCCCVYFYNKNSSSQIEEFQFRLRSTGADSHWTVKNFLSSHELDKFLQCGSEIHCDITVDERRSIKEARRQAENEVNKMCQDYKDMLLSEEDSDVTIQVRDQQFKAHRSILTARSSVFAATFRHDMKEKATGAVNIEDCDPSSFPVLLEFLYCGKTDQLSDENVFSLYTSADKYDVQGLKRKCFEFIKYNLSVDTFFETLKHSLQHPEADLSKLVVDFFDENFKKIILTTEWQAFNLENPIQVNEIFSKAFASDAEDASGAENAPDAEDLVDLFVRVVEE